MAERLARLYGTEDDKVNCPFYYKIGACRYGANCQRIHNRPPYSQTILLKNMYDNSPIEIAISGGKQVAEKDAIEAFEKYEEFYEDIFLELATYGEVEDILVCDNMGDHMRGNVFVKYVNEEDAAKAIDRLRNRKYDNKLLMPEYSPVTDLNNAKCKQYLDGDCNRGAQCNYLHLKPVSSSFKRALYAEMYKQHPEWKRRSRSQSKSRDKKKKKGHKKHSRSKDRKERKSKKHKNLSRSRSSSNEMNSEERRQMIAQWNQE